MKAAGGERGKQSPEASGGKQSERGNTEAPPTRERGSTYRYDFYGL